MNIVYVLAPLALLLGFGFAGAFIFATVRGQFDDVETPAYQILIEDDPADREKQLKGQTS